MSQQRVVVATTALEGASTKFLHAWTMFLYETFWRRKVPVIGSEVIGSSLVTYARNKAVDSLFRYYPDATHLLFIDSDMVGFSADSLAKLLEADVPIISGLCTRRTPPFKPACSDDDQHEAIYEELQKPQPGIVERKYTGMAFTLIQRDVLTSNIIHGNPYPSGQLRSSCFQTGNLLRDDWEQETADYMDAVMETAQKKLQEIENDQQLGELLGTMVADAVKHGMNMHHGGWHVGEDMDFCFRAAEQGYKTYVHCGVVIDHLEQRGRNIHDHLRSMRLGPENDADPYYDMKQADEKESKEETVAA